MAYVLRRLLEMIPVLLIVVAATFFLAHAVPGGPFDKDRPLPAEVKARLEQVGTQLKELSPDEFGAFMRAELAKYAKLVKDANIRLE